VRKSGTDWTKWVLVGGAAVLAFFVFKRKEARAIAAVATVPLPKTVPREPDPVSVVGQGRFIRAGTGGKMQCFDTSTSGYVQGFFCDQQDAADIDDPFFFPPELEG
jgi:hypothetical protein